MTPLGVGIVGASGHRGWALATHLPAVEALDEVRLAAVATTNRDSATLSAKRFGATAAYTDVAGLVADPAVDVVLVCVRAPAHAEIVEQAVRAGKHVYCEWPLGVDSAEAAQLADLADAHGVRNAIGLQARSSPLLAAVRKALADGVIGTVCSATVYSPTGSGGPTRTLASQYIADRANGVHTLSINTGHTLDTLAWLLGPITTVQATVAVRQPEATVVETGERLVVTAPDQVALIATSTNGCVVSLHAHSGARENGTRFVARFFGTEGDLEVCSAGVRGVQIEELTARFCRAGSTEWQPIVSRPSFDYRQPMLNVAEAWRRFAAAIRDGGPFRPDFAHAVALHRELDVIAASTEG